METTKGEHLSAYSPYKVMWKFEEMIYEMTGINHPFIYSNNGYEKIDNIKLILRPLSDLAKEIEHKGQKGGDIFLPARILMCPQFKFCADREDLLFDLQSPESIQRCPYNVVQKLLEWKFDIFGLPSHLWIDVNTLEENPYK